ncbi:MAG: 23S rRNA (uracil(1939)-C(5))-methyltransferase RlmD [Gammaproteobacteria bacterium]|jgi:23S rRNA (uracil1939-C5)-methyltransferase|nr:23S rRNA (uracil(1939)-C(5))-methyltransferase RlmD [Gammaproteobacteria bacterium]MBT3859437.1 23S rRNA (uracil(1939)-C(5))-methyltransferase RlmD [Gammaproteobacteria bacterium]MBT3988199.1 23S rRNA (uracil(1939)-C(5))-methyltransferase RlmD [Gammaproteobacteria bacterium]MBT4256920.1 23S rRNA (uracil(1939)-C(5))-methyltransferase RlmD [Gammaproteobacteria bacterium]MBT4583336.1 23S rRNA (uracil(1939)-C(5))-methyltransferase RlmD [Gammaproteobacteria bacterium]
MSRRRTRRNKLPSEPVELDITSLSHEGRGIAHIEGKVAFVDGALAGEKLSAAYVRRRGKFDELRAVELLSRADDRIDPVCQLAGKCGGCSLQHMNPDAQIEFKQSVLLEQLQRSAGLQAGSFELLPLLKDAQYHYRRKARLAVRMVTKKGGALVGFREKYSNFITEMDDCKVLVEEVACLIKPLRDLISKLGGALLIPQIEVAVGEQSVGDQSNAAEGEIAIAGKLQVALIFRHLKALNEDDLKSLRGFAEEHSIEIYLQPGGMDTVHKIYPIEGEERLYYHLPEFDLRFSFHPTDFTQINAGINRKIISKALSLLDLNKDDVVLDLFCGLGNFTLPLASRCKQVIGVEGSEEMVKRGSENAALNNLKNVSFYAADLFQSIEDKLWSSENFTKIVLDPPRSGAIEIIHQIAKLGAEKIVYISCNPATLARDTAEFIKTGYTLKSAGVMDMFPHTSHVESMAEFVKDKKSK